MYLTHFGLAEFPFNLTPDTAFSFASGTQREALDALRVAVDLGEGFVKVIGEVGTGKTLTCRRFIAGQPEHAVTAYLPNPSLAPRGLMTSLATELGIGAPGRLGEAALRERIERELLQHAGAGRRVVVCLDEAQTMPDETLEQLRLLSNLETEKAKLMQVVMFGQPELDRRLAQDSLRQLRQRIGFEIALGAMHDDEVHAYLDHRMRVAGFNGVRAFAAPAARIIACASGGVPRLINVIANKSLLLAYGRGLGEVSTCEAWIAARDTAGSRRNWLFSAPHWAGRGLLATRMVR